MSYSKWADSFWYTAETTGAPHINGATLFIHPKKGESKTFSYAELSVLELDTHWVALNFPDVPDMFLAEVLFFIDAFMQDMRRNRYRYSGYKEPAVGARNEQRSHQDDRNVIIDWGRSEGFRTSTSR